MPPALVKDSEEGGPGVREPVLTGLADLGLAGIAVPEEFGGAGGEARRPGCGGGGSRPRMVPGGLLGTATASVLLAEHPDAAVAKESFPAIADGSVRVALATRASTLVEHQGTVPARLGWSSGWAPPPTCSPRTTTTPAGCWSRSTPPGSTA